MTAQLISNKDGGLEGYHALSHLTAHRTILKTRCLTKYEVKKFYDIIYRVIAGLFLKLFSMQFLIK